MMQTRLVFLPLGALALAAFPLSSVFAAPTAAEIVSHCANKYQGDDQYSRLAIMLVNPQNKKTGYEFVRLWKDYKGQDGVADKVVLYTLTPLDSKDMAYMRWGYVDAAKPVDQWVYLPEMRMVRRVSQRDPNNMDWGYTDEDLRIRALDEDNHRLLRTETQENKEFYLVESTPKGNSAYKRRVSWFLKTPDWNDCVEVRVDYYDKKDELLKTQTVNWQNINGAWVWQTAVMKNVQTYNSAIYEMRDTEVNIGITGDQFTERALKRGYVDHR